MFQRALVCVYLYTIVAESREVRVARRYTLKKEKMGFVWCVSFIYFLSLECMYECNNITQQYIDVAEIRLLA